jgi:hypothetical protein
MQTGRRTVTTSAAKIFTTATDERSDVGIQILAASTNSGTIYISTNSSITANSSDENDGYPLTAGEKLLIIERNPNDIYAVASDVGQTIWFAIV